MFTIRSSGYENATRRFEEILQTKLGIPMAPLHRMVKPSSMVFGDLANAARYGRTPDYNPRNVRQLTHSTAGDIDRALSGTKMAGLGAAFKRAEAAHGINAWVLTAIASHESAFGTSQIARDKKNLFGFQAYDSSPYASARTFRTVEEGIDHVAAYLSKSYLTKGGEYYHGLAIDDIGRRYATDPQWAQKVRTHLEALIQRSE
ncbi:MAG: glucosaminidase domain-containing protein [Bacillota bacterium]|nr:glucosaminidase domain-containing protein [Bacillota bacterium]